MKGMTKEFDKAIELAKAGGFRNSRQAYKWALDFVVHGGLVNQAQGVESANLLEAERQTSIAQQQIWFDRCTRLHRKLYYSDEKQAEKFCQEDPRNLDLLEEKSTQLECAVVMGQLQMKNRNEFYSAQEAEEIARKELELPRSKTQIAEASKLPDLYLKTPQEIQKIAQDMEPKNHSGIPSLFGKTKKEIEEEAEKL